MANAAIAFIGLWAAIVIAMAIILSLGENHDDET